METDFDLLLRTLRIEAKRTSGEVDYHTNCTYPECKENTREGKPLCAIHSMHMPYVTALIDEQLQRGQELDLVAQGRRECLRKDGTLASDILNALRDYGPMTLDRLRRLFTYEGHDESLGTLSTDFEVKFNKYVEEMSLVNLVKLGLAGRKHRIVVALPEHLNATS